MIGVSLTLVLLLVEILIMANAEYTPTAQLRMVRDIRERVAQEAITFMTADDTDDMIWDIEKLIADYREAMLS